MLRNHNTLGGSIQPHKNIQLDSLAFQQTAKQYFSPTSGQKPK